MPKKEKIFDSTNSGSWGIAGAERRKFIDKKIVVGLISPANGIQSEVKGRAHPR